MTCKIIKKPKIKDMVIKPNLENYEEMRNDFSWNEIRKDLGLQDNGYINIAYESIDKHTYTNRKNKIALLWESANEEEETYTFNDLKKLTNKFANVLSNLCVKKGDRVFIFLERIPELYISVFGVLKIGAIAGPLFSAFGHDAVKDRLLDSGACVVITSVKLKKVIDGVRADLPDLKHTIVVNRKNKDVAALVESEISYESEMEKASDEFDIVKTCADDFAVMHYTSGTTGKPKGAMLVHQAIICQYATAKYVLNLKDDDIYWCTADPGWVTGTSYGMFGPWSNGISQVVYEGGFKASKWYSILEKYKINIWYSAPTAIRMLMKAGDKLVKKYDFSCLRDIYSVGEPLNPEAVIWSNNVFGVPFHDTWWQTETGSILIANYPIQDIKPGSMGTPFPGTEATILDDDWNELGAGNEGHLAIKPGWPSMFKAYWGNEKLYKSRFKNGWYITGDRAKKDEDGYFHFIGRADDVIISSGHLIGPFEVESVLIEHPAVAEAAAIGKPDRMSTEVVKAFVALKDGYEPSEELIIDIRQFARKRLTAYARPREIEFVDSLPKTRSGKIVRRILKARELGLPEGDTSTLEDD
ncbi:MAG: acetate--CoA ligase [Candidatus Anammoxibacter sp.]